MASGSGRHTGQRPHRDHVKNVDVGLAICIIVRLSWGELPSERFFKNPNNQAICVGACVEKRFCQK